MTSNTKRKALDPSADLRAELRRQRLLVEHLCRDVTGELDEIAGASGTRLANLVAAAQANLARIVELQRLQAGATKLVREVFDLHATARSAVARHTFAAAERGIRLCCYVHRDAPRSVVGDKVRLRRILSDLVAHLIACTEGGDVSVYVALETDAGQASAVRFVVCDRGDEPSAKDMVTSVQATSLEQTNWITPWYGSLRELLQRMGGRFGCHASEEGGVAVWLSLPFSTERPRPERSALATHAPVLLVSKHPERIKAITGALQRCGLIVELEAEHRRVPERLQKAAYSLVLMDRTGGAHVATYAARPGNGEVRMVPIMNVPRDQGWPETVDEAGLVHLVQRRIAAGNDRDRR